MATNCCGRRLFDLLQEQQEPFLIRRGGVGAPQCRLVAESCGWRLRGLYHRRGGGSVSVSNGGARSMLCGAKAVRKALLWDLAGCFSRGARDRFRRLPRVAGDFSDGDKQRSPVSVMQVLSEDESTEPSQSDTGDEDDDSKQSTPASSPSSSSSSSSNQHPRGTAATPHGSVYSRSGGIVRAMEVEDSGKIQIKNMEESSLAKAEHAIVSTWEKIAADISRIPRLVELDLSGSEREWRRRIADEEARRVGESIEAMIFEEVRWEAVRDMLCFSRVCALTAGF